MPNKSQTQTHHGLTKSQSNSVQHLGSVNRGLLNPNMGLNPNDQNQ